MSEKSNTVMEDNSVTEAGFNNEGFSHGRCPVDEQCRPSRQQATARKKWGKELNVHVAVMECYFLSTPVDENRPIWGYR